MSSIIKVDTIQNQSGANIINESSNTITIGASGDNIIIPSGATITNNGTSVGLGGENTPSFSAKLSASQTGITQGVYTKVQCDSEDFDTDSAYDNATNYRFTVPSGQAGKYFFSASINPIDWGGTRTVFDLYNGAFYKNGSLEKATQVCIDAAVNNSGLSLSAIIDLSVSDYVELYVKVETGSGTGKIRGGSQNTTWFQGFKLL